MKFSFNRLPFKIDKNKKKHTTTKTHYIEQKHTHALTHIAHLSMFTHTYIPIHTHRYVTMILIWQALINLQLHRGNQLQLLFSIHKLMKIKKKKINSSTATEVCAREQKKKQWRLDGHFDIKIQHPPLCFFVSCFTPSNGSLPPHSL